MARKLLIAYSNTSTHVRTTLDYVTALRDYSGYDTSFLHVTHDAYITLDFDVAGYDVIFHNYCSRFCFDGYVSQSYCAALKRFTGLKVLAIQDEYDHTDKLKAAIIEHGFQLVLTCVPQESLEFVYPAGQFPGVRFITVYTGYVPEGFADACGAGIALKDRPITVGYRGRDIGGRYGRLGFDKFEIGRKMKEICDAKGVNNDIGMDEQSRIYGTAWFDFVGRCRSMLGSESGSNVFDFDGTVQAKYTQMTKQLGQVPNYAEFSPYIADRENQIQMGQISPRVFECAVMRTPMVLFKGRYSDAIQPDLHYIPLAPDFSNVDEVLARLRDIPALEAMSERTYDHLVASGNFSYRAYIARLKGEFERLIVARARPQAESQLAVATPMTLRQQVLHEMPAEHPKTMNDYRVTQLRLANLAAFSAPMVLELTIPATPSGSNSDVYVAQIAQLDRLFHHLGCKLELETSRLYPAWLRLALRSGTSASDASAKIVGSTKSQFDHEFAKFLAERATYTIQRELCTATLASARDDTESDRVQAAADAVITLDQDWIAAYCKAYNDLQTARVNFIRAIDADAANRFKDQPVLRTTFWAHRARFRIKDSKLEFAKLVVRRIPGATALADVVLKAVRKTS